MEYQKTFKTKQEFINFIEDENKELKLLERTDNIVSEYKESIKQLYMIKEYKTFDYVFIRNSINTSKKYKFWSCGYYVIKNFFNDNIQAIKWLTQNPDLFKENILAYKGITFLSNDICEIYGNSNNLVIGFDCEDYENLLDYEDYDYNIKYNLKPNSTGYKTYKTIPFVFNELQKIHQQSYKLINTLPELKNEYVRS